MSNIYDNILDLIGHTPLIRFHKVETKYSSKANIIGKLEFFNAGFSVKSRIAKNMIEEAEKEGKLKEGDTLLKVQVVILELDLQW